MELELVRFTDVNNTKALADRLVALVGSVEDRLHMEMPQVLPRYANRDKARESVSGVRRNMRRNGGFVAYLVKYQGEVVGVVSCDQRQLMGRRRLKGLWPGEQLACGPMVAGWLGNVPRLHPLMTPVLRVLAAEIKDNPFMMGRPWTVVRVGHTYVQNHLTERTNGFGGFVQCQVDDFRQVDGVERLRGLYVAQHDIGDIGYLDRLRRPSTPRKW